MSKDASQIIHTCLEIKGTGIQCKDCSVPKKGSCQVMVNVLNRLIYSEKTKDSLKGLPIDDVRDIIAESIKNILVGEYNGYSDAQFASWVQTIAYRRRYDYFREKEKHNKELVATLNDTNDERSILENLPDLTQEGTTDNSDSKSDIQGIFSRLKEKISQGKRSKITSEDINLINTLYNGFEKGLLQEDIAKEVGLIPNTLNQKLKRLREKLHKEGILY